MSIAVVITIPTTEANRSKLIGQLGSILPDTRTFEGCESVRLVGDPKDPTQLGLIEYWSSAERYDAYRAWRAESGTSVLAGDLVAAPPSVSIYDVLD